MHTGILELPTLPAIKPSGHPLGEFLLDLLTGIVFAVTHLTATRNQLADLVVDLLDAGAGAGNLVYRASNDAEVATLPFSDPAFGNATAGTATANAITDDTNATGGTTDRFTAEDSNTNAAFLGSVGLAGEDINLSSVIIGSGDTVATTSLQYQAPA